MRVVDLFSGSGGLSIGIAEAARAAGIGTDHRLAIDNDAYANAAFSANFPIANARLGAVEDFFDGEMGDALTSRELAVRADAARAAAASRGRRPWAVREPMLEIVAVISVSFAVPGHCRLVDRCEGRSGATV